jgi:hypothetical protein
VVEDGAFPLLPTEFIKETFFFGQRATNGKKLSFTSVTLTI